MTLGAVYQAVKEIDAKLSAGAVLVGGAAVGAMDVTDVDEPADVAAALDNLGL